MAPVYPKPVRAAIKYFDKRAPEHSFNQLSDHLIGEMDDIVTQINSLGVTPTTEIPASASTSAMRVNLGVGSHSGMFIKGSGTGSVQGISKEASAGPIICEVNTTVMLSGLELRGSLANGAVLLVKAGAKAVVSDCIFRSSQPKSVVIVESGGKLLLSGCVFMKMATTSEKVIHHAVATPASAVATMCFNLTGNTFHDAANVTATHILT